MNEHKLKILSINKIHWIYCTLIMMDTDSIVFRKNDSNKIYYLDLKNNLLLQAYQKVDNKWYKFYDHNTTYGLRRKEDELNS